MTETAKTLILAALGILAVLLLLVWSYVRDEDRRAAHQEELSGWLQECASQGGIASPTSTTPNGSLWYDCIVDGQVVIIP